VGGAASGGKEESEGGCGEDCFHGHKLRRRAHPSIQIPVIFRGCVAGGHWPRDIRFPKQLEIAAGGQDFLW
jgi:hypothetical protein